MFIGASYAYALWASHAIFLLPRLLNEHSRRWGGVRDEAQGRLCRRLLLIVNTINCVFHLMDNTNAANNTIIIFHILI